MSEDLSESFGALLRARRRALGLSMSEVARRAGLDKGTLSLLENGKSNQPRPDNVRALASALEMPVADLFAAADYLQPSELPSLRPYMRAKYHDLSEEALSEVEDFIAQLVREQPISQPRGGEDEHE